MDWTPRKDPIAAAVIEMERASTVASIFIKSQLSRKMGNHGEGFAKGFPPGINVR
jgi:hypothetical protein